MVALVAEVQLEREEYASAMHLFREALRRRADLPGIHSGLAEIYRRTGHADWAAVEDGREPRSSDETCGDRSPGCLYRRKRWAELAAVAQDQPGTERHFWVSRAYGALARRAYERLTRLPPSAESHEYEARTHRERGRHDAAAESWRAALEARPGSPAYETDLAISLQMAGRFAEALPRLERLIAQSPGSVELTYALGQALLNLQRAEDAAPLLGEVAARAASLCL